MNQFAHQRIKFYIKLFLPTNTFFKYLYLTTFKKALYIYNMNFFLIFFNPTDKLIFNPKINTITFLIQTFDDLTYVNRYNNQIILLCYTLTTYFLKKIKIAGKSYRIEKAGLGFNLTVGHTLTTSIYIPHIIQKQTTKHKLYFYYINYKKIKQNFFKIIYLRLWDVYTQRGLRFGKHKLFKKQGKKSAYA